MAGASKQLPEKTNKAHGNYVEQLPCIYCFPDSTRFAASSTRLAATRRRGGGRGHARALQEPLLQPPEPQFANAATVGSPVQEPFRTCQTGVEDQQGNQTTFKTQGKERKLHE